MIEWRGYVRPLLTTYEISILYRLPVVIERIDPLRQQPEVRVISPALKHRSGNSEGDLPHVYWDDPVYPMLCLFDPEAMQWSPQDLIAETTIRWAIDWLGCYEGWRATGRWSGGGRHVTSHLRRGS